MAQGQLQTNIILQLAAKTLKGPRETKISAKGDIFGYLFDISLV
jgi:hypothetical protein